MKMKYCVDELYLLRYDVLSPEISENHVASIHKVEEKAKQGSVRQVASRREK